MLPVGNTVRVKTFGDRLVWAMRQVGLTGDGDRRKKGPRLLGHIADVDPGLVSRYMRKKRETNAQAAKVKAIADALAQDFTWLMTGSGEPREHNLGPVELPDGRGKRGAAVSEALRTLWQRHHVPIPDAVRVAPTFHEGTPVVAKHFVESVLTALSKSKTAVVAAPESDDEAPGIPARRRKRRA